jgi:hypothetical protein
VKRTIAILSLLLLAAGIAATPLIFRHYSTACLYPASSACINTLRALDGAKQQWALVEHKSTSDIPTMAEVSQYMPAVGAKPVPACPAGGIYTLGRVSDNPKCSIKGHELPSGR